MQSLLRHLENESGFQIWTHDNVEAERLIIECFPAEAIWAAKRRGCYPEGMTATAAKAYKKIKRGTRLSAAEVRQLVKNVLPDALVFAPAFPNLWPGLVEQTIKWMLDDTSWQRDNAYRGGKLLDDVVDSSLCLATAVAYACNAAHLWMDPEHPDDGHIIGPGKWSVG